MASAQVVETSVNTNNSPSQDYTTNPDDHSNHNIILMYRSSNFSITQASCSKFIHSRVRKIHNNKKATKQR